MKFVTAGLHPRHAQEKKVVISRSSMNEVEKITRYFVALDEERRI
ncbi:hypothetical protein [Pectobacterium sp. IFB5596]|nr:hypothetical protein [Pectobacterium sp. IFB5596]